MDKKQITKCLKRFLKETLFVHNIKCLFCGKELEEDSKYCTCKKCLNSLPFLRGRVCTKCGEPLTGRGAFCARCKGGKDRGFDIARAEFLYAGAIADAIKELKYFGKKYYAEYLSNFLLDVYQRNDMNCDVVIPAPISQKSLRARGFNQVELLCESFENVGMSVNTTCLAKVKETQNQVALNFKDRQTNLVDAFKVIDVDAVKGKNVLLVDDIFTTGATAKEISTVLRSAGANKVCVITLCHETIKKDEKTQIDGNNN